MQQVTVNLPNELVEAICRYVNVDSLRSLRLTDRIWKAAATKELFRHVEVHPSDESGNRCHEIMNSSALRPLVTSIAFNTSLNPDASEYNGIGDLSWEEYETESKLPLSTESAFVHIGRLDNLSSVELRFARECVSDDGEYHNKTVPETYRFRTQTMNKLLTALMHPLHPMTKLRKLAIKNLQDIIPLGWDDSDTVRRLLSSLQEFAVQIATECSEAAPELDQYYKEAHTFFEEELPRHLLQPMQTNLVHLKLYTTQMYWGWFPFCDLREVHFPKLKSLALGNFTFAFDWQLEWIISHGETLTTLVLDDSPIIHIARIEPEKHTNPDHEPSTTRPVAEGEGLDGFEEQTWTYDTRWHDYFRSFVMRLPRLRKFGIGSGPWDEGLMFEEAWSLGVELKAERYCSVDYGIGPSQFITPDKDGAYHEAEWAGAPERIPDCEKEDQEALDELVRVLQQRS